MAIMAASLLSHCFGTLEPEDLAFVESVCHSWQENEPLWQRHCTAFSAPLKTPDHTWKQLYGQWVRMERAVARDQKMNPEGENIADYVPILWRYCKLSTLVRILIFAFFWCCMCGICSTVCPSLSQHATSLPPTRYSRSMSPLACVSLVPLRVQFSSGMQHDRPSLSPQQAVTLHLP